MLAAARWMAAAAPAAAIAAAGGPDGGLPAGSIQLHTEVECFYFRSQTRGPLSTGAFPSSTALGTFRRCDAKHIILLTIRLCYSNRKKRSEGRGR